jgi:hypothetical protein
MAAMLVIVIDGKVNNAILWHSVALCNYDFGVIIPSGATTNYKEVPLLEGTFFFKSVGWDFGYCGHWPIVPPQDDR